MKSICVIGLWHLGLVNCVGLAELGNTVIGLDFDKLLITKLTQGTPPLFEPGLKEKITEYLKLKKLRFSSEIKEVKTVDYVIIAYDSPVNEKDEVDISPVINAAKKIARYLKVKTPVIITSQVPLGTSEKIEKLIKKINKNWQGGVVYTPENLRLGVAIERFLHPDMLVFGSNNPSVLKTVLGLYQPIQTKKFSMDLRSAEMVKHALNTFLATSITFGNEIANLCDRLGADALKVGMALKADKRIGHAPILPGLGFSGGTLARDVQQLIKFSTKNNYSASLLKSIFIINEESFRLIITKLTNKLGNLKGKTIGVLGLTYKPGTSTLRRSSAVKIITMLVKKGATCLGYDPKVDLQELKKYSRVVKKVSSVMELAKFSDALVLVTEWPEFRDLDYNKLANDMKKPIIIDSKNFLDSDLVKKAGFDYQGFGRS